MDRPRGLGKTYWSDPARIAAWNAFWKKAGSGEEQPKLEEVASFIAEFLGPPLHAAARDEPFKHSWSAGGPWVARPPMTESARIGF